jgi:hypothetical protein
VIPMILRNSDDSNATESAVSPLVEKQKLRSSKLICI